MFDDKSNWKEGKNEASNISVVTSSVDSSITVDLDSSKDSASTSNESSNSNLSGYLKPQAFELQLSTPNYLYTYLKSMYEESLYLNGINCVDYYEIANFLEDKLYLQTIHDFVKQHITFGNALALIDKSINIFDEEINLYFENNKLGTWVFDNFLTNLTGRHLNLQKFVKLMNILSRNTCMETTISSSNFIKLLKSWILKSDKDAMIENLHGAVSQISFEFVNFDEKSKFFISIAPKLGEFKFKIIHEHIFGKAEGDDDFFESDSAEKKEQAIKKEESSKSSTTSASGAEVATFTKNDKEATNLPPFNFKLTPATGSAPTTNRDVAKPSGFTILANASVEKCGFNFGRKSIGNDAKAEPKWQSSKAFSFMPATPPADEKIATKPVAFGNSTLASSSQTFNFSTANFSFNPKFDKSAIVQKEATITPSEKPRTIATRSSVKKETKEVEKPTNDDANGAFDPHYDSIVNLKEVQLKTGEENEQEIFKERAKLYRHFDGEWKERGVGDMKILKSKSDPKKCRILMRRDQVHKLCMNAAVNQYIKPTFGEESLHGTQHKTVLFAIKDYSDPEESIDGKFSVRFKNVESGQKFMKMFQECIKNSKV